ncbi:MAG: hypothetical protein GY859_04250 [Desulfobacterales bacterium]|nr:hypothetical protein [Desulfobacterales bacterium]
MNEKNGKLRIYVSAPSDVMEEVNALQSMARQMNQSGDMAERTGVEIEILYGSSREDDALDHFRGAPGASDGESPFDIFIGIAWLSFMARVGEESDGEGEGGLSVEDEFHRALEIHEKTGRPHCLFYRRASPPENLYFDMAQLKKVNAFFERLNGDKGRAAVCNSFQDPDDLVRIARRDIESRMEAEAPARSAPEAPDDAAAPDVKSDDAPSPDAGIKGLTPGKNYVMTFISVQQFLNAGVAEAMDGEKKESIRENFRRYLMEIVLRRKGDRFLWSDHGGMFVFRGDHSMDAAVMTGLEIYQNLLLFNLKNGISGDEERRNLQIACHCGEFLFELPLEKMRGDVEKSFSGLNEKGTRAGEFSITDMMFEKLESSLKFLFSYQSVNRTTPIYLYKETIRKDRVFSAEDLETTLGMIQDNGSASKGCIARALVKKPSELDNETVSKHLRKMYRSISDLYRGLGGYDEKWPVEYFKTMAAHILSVLEFEEKIRADHVHLFKESKQKNSPIETDIYEMILFMGRRRQNIIPDLNSLSKKYLFLSKDKKEITSIDPDDVRGSENEGNTRLIGKIDKFIEADEFNVGEVVAELLIDEREALIDYISEAARDARMEKLIRRLWETANYVLLEDIATRKRISSQEHRMVFPYLAKNPVMPKYFQLVFTLNKRAAEPDKSAVYRYFRKIGTPEPLASDVVTVLKCLLVQTHKPSARRLLVNELDFEHLWELAPSMKCPMGIIREMAIRIYQLKDVDRIKIFFNLTWERINYELEDTDDEMFLAIVNDIIKILYRFDVFAETDYFDRLENLCLKFNTKSAKYPKFDPDMIKSLAAKLKEERKGEKKPDEQDQKDIYIKELPLPVQRHLAKRGRHLNFFVRSNEDPILNELHRHLTSSNIARLMVNDINKRLMSEILLRRELFTDHGARMKALKHPNCNTRFARIYAKMVSDNDRRSIAMYSMANHNVRNYIRKEYNIH